MKTIALAIIILLIIAPGIATMADFTITYASPRASPYQWDNETYTNITEQLNGQPGLIDYTGLGLTFLKPFIDWFGEPMFYGLIIIGIAAMAIIAQGGFFISGLIMLFGGYIFLWKLPYEFQNMGIILFTLGLTMIAMRFIFSTKRGG